MGKIEHTHHHGFIETGDLAVRKTGLSIGREGTAKREERTGTDTEGPGVEGASYNNRIRHRTGVKRSGRVGE